MQLTYPFTTDETPELTQVGGKAMSLILMTQHGLPVPPGFVLSVAFFEPWLEAIGQTPEWAQALTSPPEALKRRCEALKAQCRDLELDQTRKAALSRALEALKEHTDSSLFAVRSSSPQEDLEELSFAGGYETVLGVREGALEDALRRSFASCFDERVFVYKQEHGLAVDRPRIAVIVQEQIAAETAGVAFSLNPVNNCYDEAVISANFGLGESVVAGLVSPDSFVVDKATRAILERKVGKKETAVWLGPDGGTYERAPEARLSLSDEQALELTDMLVRVEDYYGKPMDIEWAYANDSLYLLQARPITSYVPLPEALLTAPGEPKHLYADLTMLKWGMHEIVSVFGTDYLGIANLHMLRLSFGPSVARETVELIRPAVGGRAFVVLSTSMKMQGKQRVVGEVKEMDATAAAILEALDEEEYTQRPVPKALKGVLFKAITQNLGLAWRALQAIRNPAAARQHYLEEEKKLHEVVARAEEGSTSLESLADKLMRSLLDYIRVFFPVLAAALLARTQMRRVFKNDLDDVQAHLIYLERALPDNVTIDMGLAMYRLASFPEIKACGSGDELVRRLKGRAFSGPFLAAWDAFMRDFGFRCPMEMDPAAPRFYERPAQFFAQLKTMAENADPESNPQAILERAKVEREQAYEILLAEAQKKGKRKARQFAKAYETWMQLGGYRESPKYYFVLITDRLRRRVLEAAQSLVDAGRLDSVQQAFDLHIDELDRGLVDGTLDLRALAARNTRFPDRLRRMRTLPRIIDSRGKILRAPRKEAQEGELVGEPISPGVVRGPIKVLYQADEKPVLPGDILVTRATDPGWTPLFLNAGGIILEVGGMLQHGALVARKYGKPCVSGLQGATEILQDGQMVEVDGASGVVRLV